MYFLIDYKYSHENFFHSLAHYTASAFERLKQSKLFYQEVFGQVGFGDKKAEIITQAHELKIFSSLTEEYYLMPRVGNNYLTSKSTSCVVTVDLSTQRTYHMI